MGEPEKDSPHPYEDLLMRVITAMLGVTLTAALNSTPLMAADPTQVEGRKARIEYRPMARFSP